MRETRNPFKILSSEAIERESIFLRLFGPGVLGILDTLKDTAWSSLQTFRSAPGGGKTSLFRLFTPQSLLTLYESQSSDEYRDLYLRLKGLNVISETGPNILGVYLSCARNYAALEDLEIERSLKDRLLFSLLNSRIILATLRSVLEFKKLSYPDDLDKLFINRPPQTDIPFTIPVPCSGVELNRWASELERAVCNAIDSFTLIKTEELVGHDTLYCLLFLTPDCIMVNRTRIEAHILLMLDDVHKLTNQQRNQLRKVIYELRAPIGIWLAERLQALTPEEILLEGALPGREYLPPIVLEEFWRRGRTEQFEKLVSNIAERRAKLSTEVQIGTLESGLQDILESGVYETAFHTVSKRVDDIFFSTRKFELWKDKTKIEGTSREKAIAVRALEILVDREVSSAQRKLVDIPISEKILETQTGSNVNAAAEWFLSREFNIPYYFGFSRIARLSSSNIEQFLMMSGELFEEIISASLLRKARVLSPTRQEEILKKVAKLRWDEIPRTISNGRDVIRFLESLRQFCLSESLRLNAPYAPGVTGIAISMRDRDRLITSSNQKISTKYSKLAKILSVCISNNLLEASLDRKQGARGGKTWMILYLNRLLCLHFGLPLQYVGWRPRTLDQLCSYVEQGYRSDKLK